MLQRLNAVARVAYMRVQIIAGNGTVYVHCGVSLYN